MLSRSAVILVNGFRSSHGSVLCQLPKLNPSISKFQVQCRYARSFRTSLNSKESLVSELKIPFTFTFVTGSLCLAGHQYLGKLVSPRTRFDGVTPLSWWNSQPDWFKTYWLICGSCIGVFSCYRLALLLAGSSPSLLVFMNRFFVTKAKPATAVESCAQLILSAFTHSSPVHLGINMFILHNVSQTLVPELGKERFLGGYLFCAVFSGYTSMFYQLITKRMGGSIGASGAILGLLGLVMYKHPEYKFYIIFLPFWEISAPVIFASIAAIDIMGIIRGWQYLDHAGHLGGLLSGLVWEFLSKRTSQDDEISWVPPSRLSDDKDAW